MMYHGVSSLQNEMAPFVDWVITQYRLKKAGYVFNGDELDVVDICCIMAISEELDVLEGQSAKQG